MELIALLVLVGFMVLIQNQLFSKLAFRGLAYTCSLSAQEAQEGDEIELVERIENRKWLPVPWLKAEITTSKWLDFAGAQSVVTDDTRFVPSFFMVRGYQRVERRWKVKCLKRGVFEIQKVVLLSTDLLGNITLSTSADAGAAITVLPGLYPVELPNAAMQRLWGEHATCRRLLEDPLLHAGMREYTGREALGAIAWKASARQGMLMTHENDSITDQSRAVILNMQSRAYENGPVIEAERMEEALRVCAGQLTRTLKDGVPVRFLANACVCAERESTVTQAGWGAEYIHSLLLTLAGMRLEATDDFEIFLSVLPLQMGAGEIVVVTAFCSEALADFAARQTLLGHSVCVILVGNAEIPSYMRGEVLRVEERHSHGW